MRNNFLAQWPFVKNRAKKASSATNHACKGALKRPPAFMIVELEDSKRAVLAEQYNLHEYLKRISYPISTFKELDDADRAIKEFLVQHGSRAKHPVGQLRDVV